MAVKSNEVKIAGLAIEIDILCFYKVSITIRFKFKISSFLKLIKFFDFEIYILKFKFSLRA